MPEANEKTQSGEHWPVPTLTVREQEILLAIAVGCSADEVAAFHGISPLTVRNHLTNLRDKLGVRNTPAAFVMAQIAGIITLEDLSAMQVRVRDWRRKRRASND